MRLSWTQAGTGALFVALLGGMVVLPGRLLAPEHRVQVSLGASQQSQGGSVQAVPPLAHAKPVKVVLKRHAKPKPVRKPAAAPSRASNQLAAVVVRAHRAPVRRSLPPVRPVVQHHAVAVQIAPKAPKVATPRPAPQPTPKPAPPPPPPPAPAPAPPRRRPRSPRPPPPPHRSRPRRPSRLRRSTRRA